MNDGLGKQAETKIREWLDRPESGYDCDRVPDQMTGQYLTSRNICDFTCFKSPNFYHIESKATREDRFDFSMITDTQLNGLCNKAKISNVYGWVIVLFASHQRAFVFNAIDIKKCLEVGIKSININKISQWPLPYKELRTIPSRKQLLDYQGDVEEFITQPYIQVQ